jgi:putative lipoic acid-binding regulatory protein
VLLDGNSCEKPQIDYPCKWGYKIIGTDKLKLEACIFEVMGERNYKTPSNNSSSKGKFHALSTACQVESQEDRDSIFKAFQNHEAVKMVI